MSVLVHQLWVLTVEELRELVFRRRSLLSLFLYVVVVALSLWLLVRMQGVVTAPGISSLNINAPEMAPLARLLESLGLLRFFDSFLRLLELPEMLWVFQLFSMLWLPTLVALVSCDLVTIDIYRGTLRFLLLRTSRSAYYFGKMLSHLLLYCILQGASLIAVLILSALRSPEFHAQVAILTALKYLAVSIPFLWCVLAATQWVSSWSRRPMNALVRIHVFWFLFLVVAIWWPSFTPFDIDLAVGLFIPFENYPLYSMLGYSLWALLFSAIGLVGFVRRDI